MRHFMKAYSQDVRDRVINTYLNGKLSKFEIADLFKICRDTLNDWINRYHQTVITHQNKALVVGVSQGLQISRLF